MKLSCDEEQVCVLTGPPAQVPKVDTMCTALSLMPTVIGNMVRGFSTHGHLSAAKGSSSTSHALTSD
jgi:hypothetical protein